MWIEYAAGFVEKGKNGPGIMERTDKVSNDVALQGANSSQKNDPG